MLTIRLNGEQCAMPVLTVAELLVGQGVTAPRGVAVAVNGQVVPRRTWAEHRLADGDDVEIVKPIGGG